MDVSVAIAVVVALLGGGGIGAFLRARSGVAIDKADAATKVVDTSIKLMEELKEERALARTEIHDLRTDMTKQKARYIIDTTEQTRQLALCEARTKEQDQHISDQGIQLAALAAAVDMLKVMVEGSNQVAVVKLNELMQGVKDVVASGVRIEAHGEEVAADLAVAKTAVESVASDLADSHIRADEVEGPHGAASDAAAQSPPKDQP